MPSTLSSPASRCPPRAPAVSPDTEPQLVVVGVSHQNTPVQVREALAFARDTLPTALVRLRREAGLTQVMVLSTCNRVEVYAAGGARETQAIASILRAHACARGRVIPILDQRVGASAVRHAFRVAAALDSMVLGESQILGQIKEAYQAAETAGTLGPVLGGLRQHSLATAK